MALGRDWQNTTDRAIAVNRIRWLPIEKVHRQRILTLPTIYKDPFDRLLVAQAQVEGMSMLTSDANIQKYDIPTIW